MHTQAAGLRPGDGPVNQKSGSRVESVLWLAICLAAGAAVSWLSLAVSTEFAPFLLFPLVCGALLGLLLVGSRQIMRLQWTSLTGLGVCLAAAVAVMGQHYLSYRQQELAAAEEAAERFMALRAFPELAARALDPPAPVDNFWQYMRQAAERGRPLGQRQIQGATLWAWWAADACLTLLAAAAMVYWQRPQSSGGREEPA